MSTFGSSGGIPFEFQTRETVALTADEYAKLSILIEMRVNGHIAKESARAAQIKEDSEFIDIVEDCCQDIRERLIRRDELRRVMTMFSIKKT